MKNRTLTIVTTLVLWVTLVLSSSCTPTEIEPAKETLIMKPTEELVPIQTVTPEHTLTPTPTEIPEVESGLIEENLPESAYVQMYQYDGWFDAKPPDPENIYYKMYASHEWTEEGLQIVTPLDNTILIERPISVSDNLVSITVKRNGIATSTLTISKGTIFCLKAESMGNSLEETLRKSYYWELFDSRTGDIVSCAKTGFCQFDGSVAIGISEDWVMEAAYDTKKKGDILIPYWFIDGKSIDVKYFTYRFEDGEIYQFGPEPLTVPYVKIEYPS